MRKQFLVAMSFALGFILISATGHAKTFRASDMTSDDWSHLVTEGEERVVIEFRHGDEIPVSLVSEGDLLETVQTGVTYVKVKQSFWLRVTTRPY
jgi:hypothetical protein